MATTPNVGYTHPDLEAMLTRYKTIDDCLAGETAIKKAGRNGDAYLIRPGVSIEASSPPANAEDDDTISSLLYDTAANEERFKQYVARAVFYGVTQRTHRGMVGACFQKPPTIELPGTLTTLAENCDGAGVSLAQQAERVVSLLLGHGRCGMLADWPTDEMDATQEDLVTGRLHPTLTVYHPASVINWRTVVVGASRVLCLVVISETKVVSDDGFESKTEQRWRVLSLGNELDDDRITKPLYRQIVWKKADQGGGYEIEKEVAPRDGRGKRWTKIPFSFGGAINNDPDVDEPPIEPLALLNLAHYRDSADLQEMLYMVGQGTPVVSGLDENWAKEILKGKVQLGSRGLVPLPKGGSADLLQLAPNQLLVECMDRKERQMVALGAKLVEQRQVQRTATEAEIENAAELSVVGTCVRNAEALYRQGLAWCAEFLRLDGAGIDFKINAELGLGRLAAGDAAQILAAYDKGLISWPEARDRLRRAGYFEGEDDQAMRDMAKDKPSPTKMPVSDGAEGADPTKAEVQDSMGDQSASQ
jgi:hypothetical protein